MGSSFCSGKNNVSSLIHKLDLDGSAKRCNRLSVASSFTVSFIALSKESGESASAKCLSADPLRSRYLVDGYLVHGGSAG
jgi:hypothetical protein